jgi:hypothetical protein
LEHKRKKDPKIGPITDVRVWENKNGVLHVNWLISIPDRLRKEFEQKLPKWVSKAVGGIEARIVEDQEVYNLNGLLNYVLKGTERKNAHRFDIKPSPQGEIWGRRALAARGLGKAAREQDWEAGRVIQTEQKYRRVNNRPFDVKDLTPPAAATKTGLQPVFGATEAEVEHGLNGLPDPSILHETAEPLLRGL